VTAHNGLTSTDNITFVTTHEVQPTLTVPVDRLTRTDTPWPPVETLRSKSVRRMQNCACDSTSHVHCLSVCTHAAVKSTAAKLPLSLQVQLSLTLIFHHSELKQKCVYYYYRSAVNQTLIIILLRANLSVVQFRNGLNYFCF